MQLYPANIRFQLADLESTSIQRKGSFARNEVLAGILGIGERFARILLFFSGNLLRIRHNTLDERVIVQFFLVHQLAIHNAALGQRLPDGNGVDVVKSVLFRFGVEPLLLDEMGNPALYLGPGQHRSFGAFRAN